MVISISHNTQQQNRTTSLLPHVLFIDDNRANNYLIKAYIELDNIPIISDFELNAIHAIDNLAKLEEADFPDIIFVDINMPLKNGFEFVEDFVTQFPNVKTEIYIMSSSIRPSDKEKINQYDIIKAYIEKPITADILKPLIENK